MNYRICLLFSAMGILLMLPKSTIAQTPSLTITSPTNETSVQPGQTVQVTVSTINSSLLANETVVGEVPLIAGGPFAAANNLSFTVTVPNNIQPGRYFITALGFGPTVPLIKSTSVSLLVPLTTDVESLVVVPNPLVLPYAGSQDTVEVDGVNNTGQFRLNSAPLFLSFMSSNPAIATVSKNGTVTAQSPGNVDVLVNYANGTKTLSTTLKVHVQGNVRGDLNGDGRVDLDDVNILDSSLNAPANGPNDARDLNHDGVINALDARILTTLCTYPRCATHQ